MSFQSPTYAEALEKARNRPQKKRTPLRSRSPLKLAQKPLQRKQKAVKKPKPKKIGTKRLKAKVWKEFSMWVRANKADGQGFVLCFTCPVRLHWKQLQAGHFIRGRLNANLFDERGCNPQCHRCNIHFQGNVVIYYQMMLLHYGQGVIDELITQNNKTHKWEPGELQSLLDRYKTLNAANPLLKGSPDEETNPAV